MIIEYRIIVNIVIVTTSTSTPSERGDILFYIVSNLLYMKQDISLGRSSSYNTKYL
jgi:hypothetical protein